MNTEPPVTILVVDDNPATLYSTSRILRSAGWTVLEAATGADALATARSRELSLVVLDVHLPDIDGFDICRRLRADEFTAGTPVIHLSASFINDVDKVQGLEGGAVGYLTHPVEPLVLIATIRAFLRTRRAEMDLRNSEAKFRAVFNKAINGIALMTGELRFLDVNPSMRVLFGVSPEEIAMSSLSAYILPHFNHVPAKIIEALDREGLWRGILPVHRADGTSVHLEWNVTVHSVPGMRLAIVTDISQRLEIEREREALLMSERTARADAERANRLKDEFLAMVSHELRTPLNAIVGWSELLKRGNLEKDDFATGLAIIERNAKAQADLINDLLDISSINSGKLHLDMAPVNPAAVIESAVAAVMPSAETKHIHIIETLNPPISMITGDYSRLQQVVSNLLTNAVKFTNDGGEIEIMLVAVDGHVEIRVRDTGQGIAQELLPHIFERFRQGDSSTVRGYRGLGLGLAIAKHIVEMHGGTIRAESAGVGRGALFTLILPAVREESNPPLTPKSPQAKSPHCSADELSGIRILVVDDDSDARVVVRRLLRASAAHISEASSAAEALAIIEQVQPHVLITDIGMPEQDGYDFIKELRLRGHTPQTLPAIALTAFAYGSDRERALLEGFQAHVAKPVNIMDLINVVAALVRRDEVTLQQ